MNHLESLHLAEDFFASRLELLPVARAFLHGALERWPDVEIVSQKSQVSLRAPHPFCALSTHIRFPRQWVPARPYVTLSLFLPRPLADLRGGAVIEPYPGRFTNHVPLFSPDCLNEELWQWAEEARQFRNSPVSRSNSRRRDHVEPL